MTSHCITWHDTTQAITSHQMTWPSHDLTPEQTSRHQNTSLQSTKHHHHGRAEGSFTAKKWFGHRAGRSPCAHSIGKFFLCYIVLFLLETSAPGLSGHYWYRYLRFDGHLSNAGKDNDLRISPNVAVWVFLVHTNKNPMWTPSPPESNWVPSFSFSLGACTTGLRDFHDGIMFSTLKDSQRKVFCYPSVPAFEKRKAHSIKCQNPVTLQNPQLEKRNYQHPEKKWRIL